MDEQRPEVAGVARVRTSKSSLRREAPNYLFLWKTRNNLGFGHCPITFLVWGFPKVTKLLNTLNIIQRHTSVVSLCKNIMVCEKPNMADIVSDFGKLPSASLGRCVN